MSKEQHKPRQIEAPVEGADTALTVQDAPGALTSDAVDMSMLEASEGEGSKDISLQDIALPFYKFLNASAKEVIEGEGKYIEGAQKGMILNNVTRQLIAGKTGILVLRVAYEREFVEWASVRGGGPKGRHAVDSAVVKTGRKKMVPDGQGGEKEVIVLPNGNYVVDTRYHYVVVLGAEGRLEWATIPMSGAQLKYSDRWNSMIQEHQIENSKGIKFHPAHYQQMYLMKTFPDKNAKGNYYSWDITKAGDVQSMRSFSSAKDYREAVLSGALKSAIGNDEPSDKQHSDADDDGVPF